MDIVMQVFFKLLEREKQRVPAYKAEMQAIEKGYETIIEKITQNPNGIQEEDFPAYLMKNVESEEKIPFPSEPKKESVRMPVPAIARSLPTQIEPKKPVPKKEQEPDL